MAWQPIYPQFRNPLADMPAIIKDALATQRAREQQAFQNLMAGREAARSDKQSALYEQQTKTAQQKLNLDIQNQARQLAEAGDIEGAKSLMAQAGFQFDETPQPAPQPTGPRNPLDPFTAPMQAAPAQSGALRFRNEQGQSFAIDPAARRQQALSQFDENIGSSQDETIKKYAPQLRAFVAASGGNVPPQQLMGYIRELQQADESSRSRAELAEAQRKQQRELAEFNAREAYRRTQLMAGTARANARDRLNAPEKDKGPTAKDIENAGAADALEGEISKIADPPSDEALRQFQDNRAVIEADGPGWMTKIKRGVGISPRTATEGINPDDAIKINAWEAAKASIIHQLSGSAASEAEVRRIENTYIPGPDDPPEVKATKLRRLQEQAARLRRMAGPSATNRVIAPSNPLLDAARAGKQREAAAASQLMGGTQVSNDELEAFLKRNGK